MLPVSAFNIAAILAAAVLFAVKRRRDPPGLTTRFPRNRSAMLGGGVVTAVHLSIILAGGGGLPGVVPAVLAGLFVAAVVDRVRPVGTAR